MDVIPKPYLLFLGDAPDELAAKTASGVAKWRPEWCVGQLRLPGCKSDLGLEDLSLEDGRRRGAVTLIIGVANRGGFIPPSWIAEICRALECGYDIANGLHQRLSEIEPIAFLAKANNRQLYEVRHPGRMFPVGTGIKRQGLRLLTVGTDCSVGKMFTALALEKEMHDRGIKADFRATGQTGVLIAGAGFSIDAVVADFVSGAVECLAPDNVLEHWDIIEGQGSLFHASYAGVSLALLHGAQPDAIVLCHEPTRPHMRGLRHSSLPDPEYCLEQNIAMARLTNPNVRCAGISLNTSNLESNSARQTISAFEKQFGLPVTDPIRWGVGSIVDYLVREWKGNPVKDTR